MNACNFLRFGDATFSIFVCNFRQKVLAKNKDYVTLKEGADYYNVTLKVFTRIAREAGAVYKIGKMVRIRRDILEEYLRSIQLKKQ